MLYLPSVINWINVLFNGIWILGLSIILAAFSYQYWLANELKSPVRAQLQTQAFQRAYWISLVLVGIGLTGTSNTWWEAVIWITFTLIGAYQAQTFLRQEGAN